MSGISVKPLTTLSATDNFRCNLWKITIMQDFTVELLLNIPTHIMKTISVCKSQKIHNKINNSPFAVAFKCCVLHKAPPHTITITNRNIHQNGYLVTKHHHSHTLHIWLHYLKQTKIHTHKGTKLTPYREQQFWHVIHSEYLVLTIYCF